MHKRLSFAIIALCMASALVAAPADEKLFVEPALSELASHMTAQVAFDAALPLAADKKASYDVAFSVNQSQKLPTTIHKIANNTCSVMGLGAHLRELADSLKAQGKGLVVVPASYDVLFTDGSASDEAIVAKIEAVLNDIGGQQDRAAITEKLGSLKEVLRATFIPIDGKLALVRNEKVLVSGQKVWRKTPEGVSEEIYHSEEECLLAMRAAGLVCQEVKRPCFFGEVKWQAYNAGQPQAPLGLAYQQHNPFTLFVVSKA